MSQTQDPNTDTHTVRIVSGAYTFNVELRPQHVGAMGHEVVAWTASVTLVARLNGGASAEQAVALIQKIAGALSNGEVVLADLPAPTCSSRIPAEQRDMYAEAP